MLDSFGTPHPDTAEKLKEYLVLEGQTKHSLCFETSGISAVLAKDIPRQNNFYDCGVYIIWYFKVLLQSPDDLVDGLLQGKKVNEKIWLNMTASKFREDMIQTILDLLKKQGIDPGVGRASEPSSLSPPQDVDTTESILLLQSQVHSTYRFKIMVGLTKNCRKAKPMTIFRIQRNYNVWKATPT